MSDAEHVASPNPVAAAVRWFATRPPRTRRAQRLILVASLIAIAVVASGCEIRLPFVDCSWINQPDSGGIVCAGIQVIALQASLIALILAIILGLGSLATG
jgi:hypothetical protein